MTRLPKNGELPRMERINPPSSARTWVIPPKVTTNEDSSAESNDSLTIPDVPISNGYLTKIITEKARGECPDFIEPAIVNEVQKALVEKRLEEVAHSAPGPQKQCWHLNLRK